MASNIRDYVKIRDFIREFIKQEPDVSFQIIESGEDNIRICSRSISIEELIQLGDENKINVSAKNKWMLKAKEVYLRINQVRNLINYIIIDIDKEKDETDKEIKKRFEKILEQIKKDFPKGVTAVDTGSNGYHVLIKFKGFEFFEKELRENIKEYYINKYQGESGKCRDNAQISLDVFFNCNGLTLSHWKTKKPVKLIFKSKGSNPAHFLEKEYEEYLKKRFQSKFIKINNLENISLEMHKNQRINFRGTPLKIKKSNRVKSTIMECLKCGNTKFFPCDKSKATCQCGNRYMNVKEREFISGFTVKIINNINNITQENCMVDIFVSFSSMGIDVGKSEDDNVRQFLSNTGSLMEIWGVVKPIKDRLGKFDFEIITEKIKKIDFLKQFDIYENYERLKEYFSKKWDNEEIDDYIIPEVIGRTITKKAILLTALTPLKLNGGFWGNGRGIVMGDEGEAKTVLPTRFIKKYMSGLNALHVNSETISSAGLKAGLVKDGDEWIIDWGILTWADNGFLCLDGYHAFDKESMASLRETEEKNQLDIYKIVKGSRRCAWRGVKIANCRYSPLRDNYPNKYEASFDIGTGSNDEQNKLSGADRRRVDWIIVYSKDDVDGSDVDEKLMRTIEDSHIDPMNDEIVKKLITFAWTLTPKDINLKRDIINKLLKILKEWRIKYKNIDLSIFGKKASIILIRYTIASAILHFNVNRDGIVTPNEEDVDYVKGFFEDICDYLECNNHIERVKKHEIFCDAIIESIKNNEKLLNVLKELHKYKSQREIERKGIMSRRTIYKYLSEYIRIQFSFNNELITIDKYSLNEGYKKGLIEVPQAFSDGKITDFGRVLMKKLNFYSISAKNPTPRGMVRGSNNNNNNFTYSGGVGIVGKKHIVFGSHMENGVNGVKMENTPEEFIGSIKKEKQSLIDFINKYPDNNVDEIERKFDMMLVRKMLSDGDIAQINGRKYIIL